jgi:NADH-quinone oxidoreductase subunit E
VGETTADGSVTLLEAECLAGCGYAPLLQVNGEFHENLTPERIDALLATLR